VDLQEVEENDWSLTPGRYVGVNMVEDDGVDYKARLLEIQSELDALNKEAAVLAETIANNLKGVI
jgi:type I restriction enzyme M protein